MPIVDPNRNDFERQDLIGSLLPLMYGDKTNRSIPNPVPEPDEKAALGGSIKDKEGSVERSTVRFVGYRVRPLDPDNFAGSTKDLLDGLRHSGIIPDDRWQDIRLETEQKKVSTYKEERTEVYVKIP